MKLEHNNRQSLGAMLKEHRLAKKISLEDLSITTKIHKRLIKTLESDDYSNFPNRVYILGFLKSMSEELGFNLKEAVSLYEMQSWKFKQQVSPEIIEEIPIPDKTVSFYFPMFFKHKKMIKAKWLVQGAFLFVVMVIISPMLIENKIPYEKKETTKVVVEKKTINRPKIKNNNSSIERKIAYIQGSQKVSISAKNGNSWISFVVDKNPLRQLTLKKGSSIILSGEKIKLTVGNYKALEVKNNNVIVSNFKSNKNKTVSVSFPQKVIDKSNASELILSHDVIQLNKSRL